MGDTYKVSKIEGYAAWDMRDLDVALDAWHTHNYGEWFDIGEWRLNSIARDISRSSYG